MLAAAAAGFAGAVTAPAALADSAVTVSTTADETSPGDGACSLREAILYAEHLNGSNHDCGATATGTTTINVPAGHYTFSAPTSFAWLNIGGPGPVVIAGTAGTIFDGRGMPMACSWSPAR